MSKPSVLLITMDELNREALSCYGAASHKTPNLDQLAAEGIVFDNAYTTSPLCLPARCSLATGLLPHRTRSYCNGVGRSLDLDLPNLFNHFRSHGYRTSLHGKGHFVPVPYGQISKEITQEWEPIRHYYMALGLDHLDLQDDTQVSAWFYDDYAKDLEAEGLHGAFRYNCHHARAADGVDLPGTFPFPGPGQWHPDAWVGRKALEYIEQFPTDQPGMVWVSFPGPHYPINTLEEYLAKVDIDKIPDPPVRAGEWDDERKYHRKVGNGPAGGGKADGDGYAPDGEQWQYSADYWKRFRQAYFANVVQIDEWIGRIVAAAKARWGDDLVVVFTADHGDMLGAHGFWGKEGCAYNQVWKVPLLLAGAAKGPDFRAGQRSNAMVQTTDVLPTLLGIAGLPPVECDGKDLRQLAGGEGHEIVVSQQSNFLAACDGKVKYVSCRGFEELYDVQADPENFVNLIDSPERDERMRAIEAYIARKQRDEHMTDVLFFESGQDNPPWLREWHPR
jgi:arylsulfatase